MTPLHYDLHLVRHATEKESARDCCGDRYPCYITHVCSCGAQACQSCISSHLLVLHWDNEAEKQEKQRKLEVSARAKLATMTSEEKKILGITI